MKTMKRLFATVLAVMMAFCLSVPAFAASITISNAVSGQTYTAYKIFDVTTNGSAYAYSISATSNLLSIIASDTDGDGVYTSTVTGLTLTLSGDGTKYNVELTDAGAEALAAELNKSKNSLGTAAGQVTAGSTSATITNLEAGYYFVDSSLGATCALVTADSTFTLIEKNTEPTSEKTANETSTSVGDTVTFTITVKAGGKADTSYIVHDEMSEGLTLNANSIEVKLNGVEVDSANYSIATTGLSDNCDFEVTFPQSYTSTLSKTDEITITYTATVNAKAVTGSETNKEYVQYGSSNSVENVVTVYNYQFDLKKTDGTSDLSGAEFDLYDAETDGNQIKLVAVDENGDGETDYYRPQTAEEIAAGRTSDKIVAGTATIKGLAAGTYYLEETKAPDGYNQLTKRVDITVNATTDGKENGTSVYVGENALKVVNQAGSELPTTGGMGTTMFYVVGGILVAGAAVLLITKKRMEK